MKEYIKYIPLGLFVAFSAKMLISGVSLETAPVFGILAAFSAYLINRDEKKNLEIINSRLQAIEGKLNSKEKEVEELRSHVSSLKLGQQMSKVARF